MKTVVTFAHDVHPSIWTVLEMEMQDVSVQKVLQVFLMLDMVVQIVKLLILILSQIMIEHNVNAKKDS